MDTFVEHLFVEYFVVDLLLWKLCCGICVCFFVVEPFVVYCFVVEIMVVDFFVGISSFLWNPFSCSLGVESQCVEFVFVELFVGESFDVEFVLWVFVVDSLFAE